MNAFLHVLRETYLRPFANLRRSISYLGLFIGIFGYNVILIGIPLNTSHSNDTALLSFYVTMFGVMGLLFFPIFYSGYSTLDGKRWRVFLMALQAFSFIPLYYARNNLILAGAICGLISTVFWGMYNIAMRDNTTEGRRGYQVVLGDNLSIISSALSAWIAVKYTAVEYRSLLLLFSCFAMFAGSLCYTLVSPFYYDSKLRTFLAKARVTWRQHHSLLLRVVQRSCLATPDVVFPALMYFLHYTPMAIGGFIIVRTVIQTFLSPAIATLIQRRKTNEYRIGFALCALAWTILLLGYQDRAALFTFMLINATGLRILNNAIMVRIYEITNYSGLLINEIYLGLSRMTMLAVLIPVLFWDSRAYIIGMTLVSLAMLIPDLIVTVRKAAAAGSSPGA